MATDTPVDATLFPISLADVRAAAARLDGVVHRTPILHSASFDERAGAEVWFKAEQFQRTGSFKMRGAYNMIASLDPDARQRGVIAFSSGNHAQAVALSAQLFGIPAVIVMPADSPSVKMEATAGYGAEIVIYDRLTQDREAIARQIADERGLTLVPPYNNAAIMAGQGTVALEFLEQRPDLDVIVAATGGGGLVSGTAIAARGVRLDIKVIAAGTEGANHAWLSKRSDERVSIPVPDTIADAIRTGALGTLTWPVVRQEVADVVLVSDEEVREALRFVLLRLKTLIEPTAAVAAAAALTGKLNAYGKRIGVILCGGNIAPDQLAALLNAQ
jgi:threonine dehydratase